MKRKKILILTGVLLLLMAGVALLVRHGAGTLPFVAEVLPAQQTVAFAALEQPDAWLRALDDALAKLPEGQRLGRIDRVQLTTLMGFDPADAQAWQREGVDAQRGLALTVDARAFIGKTPQPLVWVAGGPPHVGAAQQHWLKVDDWSMATQSQVTPQQLQEGPKLARDPVLRAAFDGMPTGPRLALYASADGLQQALSPPMTPKMRETLSHVTQRLRGMALAVTPAKMRARTVLSAEGVESLRQIFGKDVGNQHFSQHMPTQGFLALRLSFNLRELFDGVMTWIPPSMLEARLGLASVRMGLLALTGIDWTQLERAFAGQLVVGVDLGQAGTETAAFLLLSVRDQPIADAAIGAMKTHSGQGGMPIFVAQRLETVYVLAQSAETLARLVQAQPATHGEQVVHALDGDVVLGLAFEPPHTGAMAGLPVSALTVVHDPAGLLMNADARPLELAVMIAGWIVRRAE